MLIKEPSLSIRVIDLVLAISTAVDLISPKVSNHHKRVAYIAGRLGEVIGLSKENNFYLLISGALHDIGEIAIVRNSDFLNFDQGETSAHCEAGYHFLNLFPPFEKVANIVRFHHTNWKERHLISNLDEKIFRQSQILNLSDKIDQLLNKNIPFIQQCDTIVNQIDSLPDDLYDPFISKAFKILARDETFWLDLFAQNMDIRLRNMVKESGIVLNNKNMIGLTRLFSYLIDFRSHSTATHSSSVAAVAKSIAIKTGQFNKQDLILLRIAGHLHDLGKIAVSSEIIEKPGELDDLQYRMMRNHSYFTRRILEDVEGFEKICDWASNHHERMDGKGYPFKLQSEELSLGARIMAIADTYVALSEDRSYRDGLSPEESFRIINEMGQSGAFDPELIEILRINLHDIDVIRIEAFNRAHQEYEKFLETALKPIMSN